MERIALYCLLLVILPCAFAASPSITAASATFLYAKEDENVLMSCQVMNIGNNTVDWHMIDHNTHISSGTDILVDSARYSIAVPMDSVNGSSYNLVINRVKKTDQGHYACSIEGTDMEIDYYLKIENAVTPPTSVPISANFNFSDCCVSEGLKKDCQVLCTPMSIPVNFNIIATCPLALPPVLKCATDGKNHAACCKRKSVPNMCLDFCLGKIPDNLNEGHASCLMYFPKYMSCIEEGRNYLPGPVNNVRGISAVNLITVLWKNSEVNGDLVTGFKVHYKLSSEKNYRSTDLLEKSKVSIQSDQFLYMLNDLMENKEYYIYVTAVAVHGSSQPSTIVAVQTKSMATATSRNETIYACCDRRLTKNNCKQALCHSSGLSTIDPTLILGECWHDFQEVLKCFAGERDHSGCCSRIGVPDHCAPFCGGGEIQSISWNTTQCISLVAVIEGCIEEGSGFIPSTPTNVVLRNVGYDSVDIEWKPSPLATSYVVSYKQDYAGKQPKEISVTGGADVKIVGLKSLTPYKVKIIAQNNNGSSLPTPPVIFLTESKPPVVTGPTTPVPTLSLDYNLTECCVNGGFKKKCLPLCDYKTIISPSSTILSLFLDAECLDDVLVLVKCGADGRNHQECCASKGVPHDCLPLCSYNGNEAELSSDMNDLQCALKTSQIAQCFYEGLLKFPLPPQDLALRIVASHIAMLTWREPTRGPPVDMFRVFYKADGATQQMQNATKRTVVTLNNLKPETGYKVTVIAMNSNGTSANSDTVGFTTLPYDGDKNCTFEKHANQKPKYSSQPTSSSSTNNVDECQQACEESSPAFQTCMGYMYIQAGGSCTLYQTREAVNLVPKTGVDYYEKTCKVPGYNTTVDEMNWTSKVRCCENSGLDADCIPYCISGTSSAPHKCLEDFNKVIGCAADGRNHESCCKVNGVPDICLPFCRGQAMKKDSVGALCLTHTATFLTCTGLGVSVLPSRPNNPRVTDRSSTYFVFAWDTPAENCNDKVPCQYDVQYNQADLPDAVSTVTVNTLYINITNLKPDTQYAVRLFARNVNGSSLPTVMYYHRTYKSDFLDMKVGQIPPNIIDAGKYVKLVCSVYGSSSVSFNWTYDGKVISSNHEYILKADMKTEGRYTCKAAMNGGTRSISRDINLNVRYTPDIVTVSGSRVEPDKGYTGNLKCEFKGSPLKVVWQKDGVVLNTTGYYRYHQWENVELDKFLVRSTFQIYNVRKSDFGKYSCTGTNYFGTHKGFVNLIDANEPPITTPQPQSPANVSECCKSYGITGFCLDICNVNVNLNSFIGNNKYQICLLSIEGYLKCITDGKDHTPCCRRKGVSEFCLSFCSATIPDITGNRILECVDQSVSLLDCVEENADKVPTPPQNVHAKLDRNKIIITWEPPKQQNNLEYYEVFWTRTTPTGAVIEQTEQITLHKDMTQYLLKDPNKGIYQFEIKAKNDVGESQKAVSNKLNITDVAPLMVQNLRGQVTNRNIISLSWDAVSGPVDNYTIIYTVEGSSAKETTKNTTISLKDLNFDSTYTVSVIAENQFGSGPTSKVLRLTTGKSAVVARPSTGSKNVVVGVSIAVVLVVLVAIAIAVVLYLRHQGKGGFSRNEAVAFENPQYGSSSENSQVQISGLPGDGQAATTTESFDYQPLQEEQDAHPYDNPATLKVDQVGVAFK